MNEALGLKIFTEEQWVQAPKIVTEVERIAAELGILPEEVMGISLAYLKNYAYKIASFDLLNKLSEADLIAISVLLFIAVLLTGAHYLKKEKKR